eukprot:EC119466.1.p1 GENE.EC119466.1~~EC119466.1.p1  ORF type:complete len:135 (+),score=5.94 EC119466.1:20-424(+)
MLQSRCREHHVDLDCADHDVKSVSWCSKDAADETLRVSRTEILRSSRGERLLVLERCPNHSAESITRRSNYSAESTTRCSNHGAESITRCSNHSAESITRRSNYGAESTTRCSNHGTESITRCLNKPFAMSRAS